MIEMDDDGDITSYTYDRENRLIEAELPDSTTIEYEYGPNGDRLKRYDGTDTIYYVYDGEDVLMELDGSGNVEARYTHVPADAVGGGSCESCGGEGGTSNVWAIDYPLMMRRDSENYFYMKDKLGSIVGLLDDEENVVASYEYDAFGSIVGETSSVWNPYRFTGREYDLDTKDYYYRARTYKPETGRFMQLDPMGMVDRTNMYVYVINNPINLIDPQGHWYSYSICYHQYKGCIDRRATASFVENCKKLVEDVYDCELSACKMMAVAHYASSIISKGTTGLYFKLTKFKYGESYSSCKSRVKSNKNYNLKKCDISYQGSLCSYRYLGCYIAITFLNFVYSL